MSDDNKLMTKILALKAKAESTDNAAEAEAFMAKVAELVDKNNIDELDLVQVKESIDEEFVHECAAWKSYQRHLVGSIARYYDARCYWQRGWDNEYKFYIIGSESSRAAFKVMLPYVLDCVQREASAFKGQQEKMRTQIGTALSSRIYRLAEQRHGSRPAAQQKAGLIVVDAVEAWMEKHKNIKSEKTRGRQISRAAVEAASRVNMNDQVGKNSPAVLKIEG